ncbi:MAG: MerR family DNA-binding transcriptional regulator [Actinobacteria bacterium]|jgi:molybdopterin-binding protein|nr:MAG: MerR family DNA-binding transcriptional regulator [Actinomycetota bacterium]
MPRQRTYSASEAAAALGISVDTLRRWDRTGRIRTRRDAANRRTVTAAEIARLRGREPHELSARNRFRGIVREIKAEGLLAQVELEAGPFRVVAVVTREAVEELGLKPGAPATAIVKATSVMLER